MKTHTIHIDYAMLVAVIDGSRGILIDPHDELVVLDTIIPDARLADALDYLVEDYEDAEL
jgi:hypothetical protein